MKIGDRFWVSDYFSNQGDDLEEFEVVKIGIDAFSNGIRAPIKFYYLAKRNIKGHSGIPSPKLHYFNDNGSVDVMSARLYFNTSEVDEYYAKVNDRDERRELAMKIYPEGFE